MKVYVGYFFNHDSPLRRENHINQKIVMAVKRLAGGGTGKLFLGDINVKKEFNFAGDLVTAVWKLLHQEEVFEAVLGCGKAYSIKEWVVYCFEKLNLNWNDHVEQDPQYIREYEILVSDPRVIHGIGWRPVVDFQALADMMLKE